MENKLCGDGLEWTMKMNSIEVTSNGNEQYGYVCYGISSEMKKTAI